MSSVRFCNSFFIDLTSPLYFVFFVVALFKTFCDVLASIGLATSTLDTDEEGVSPLLVTPFDSVSFDVVSAVLCDCDADEVLVGTADLEEEKK